jgi:Secretion system C-terminal sorting domain
MKKVILFLLIVGFSQSVKALHIENIVVSPINSQDINIHLKVIEGNVIQYNSFSYTIVDNTIALTVCYREYPLSTVTTLENDFIIPSINSTSTNYMLIINVNAMNWVSGSLVCNYGVLSDTANLNFSTRLTLIVNYLSNNDFGFENNKFKLFPNPTIGSLNIKFNEQQQNISMTITNVLGQVVASKKYAVVQQITQEIIGENGIYFVIIENENHQRKTVKIVKQ